MCFSAVSAIPLLVRPAALDASADAAVVLSSTKIFEAHSKI